MQYGCPWNRHGRWKRGKALSVDKGSRQASGTVRWEIPAYRLSNFFNSEIYSVYVLTQFKAQSLLDHIEQAWRLSDIVGDRFITAVPAQMQNGKSWYQGTADSVRQNLHLVQRHDPKVVAVFGADHVYRMNIRQMIEEHRAKEAEATVAVLPVKIEGASAFGIVEVDEEWRIIGFEEKPAQIGRAHV